MGELKPGWRRVKFGQLAECVNDRVDDPSQAGVDRYVGLEHLDPESLTIRRWGMPDQVESTKLRFRPGDIIFGKRRAYQRKLAVADFEGICSAHAMVLRARPGEVLAEFLPFFMQSDTFMERAQAISVGSLSPTINWKTLAAEEFSLPPLEVQRRLVKLLLAAGEAVESLAAAGKCADDVCRAIADTHFSNRNSPAVALGDAAILVTKGESPNWQGFGYVDSGIPFITSENVLLGKIDLSSPKYIPSEFHAKLARSQLRPGDVLINIVGASIGRAAVVPPYIAEGNTNQAVAVVRVDPLRLLPEYFCQWFLASGAQRQIRSQQVNTARANISLGDIRSLQVPIPSLVEQHALVDRIAACRVGERSLGRHAEVLRQLRIHAVSEALS